MSAEPSVVRIDALRKRYGSVVALDGISLDVKRGEMVAILGPSGCGKTTALRLIAGYETPDAGTIDIEGIRVSGPSTRTPPERRGVGFVVQDLALFPHLTVRDNVGYGLRGAPDRDRRVDELLDLVGLMGQGDRMPHELSGGMAQRVALSRALARRPAVVLLDEPFSSLDQALRVQLRDELRSILRAAEQTAVFVTHDQGEALSTADRIAVMASGTIVQVSTPELIHSQPATPWVARFVGLGGLVDATCHAGVATTSLGRIRLLGHEADWPEGACMCLIRPEHLEVSDAGEDTIPVQVTARRFEGTRVLVELLTPSAGRVWAEAPVGLRALAPGDATGIVLRSGMGTVAFRTGPEEADGDR